MVMNKIFEEVLLEVSSKKYNGNNPNSFAAWRYPDVSPSQNGRILLDDKYENFEWDQNKSNQNIENQGDGKGFSFYFARYAYNDNYLYRDSSLSSGGYSGVLASIYSDFLKKFHNSQLSQKLSPNGRILLVIDKIDENSRINIISAHYTIKNDLLNIYAENFAEQLISKDEQKRGLYKEKTDKIRIMIKEKIIKKTVDSLIKGTLEFEQLLKSTK
jgi:hypothetical protein